MVKKKTRLKWGWWLTLIILILIAANLFFYLYYYSPLFPKEEAKKLPEFLLPSKPLAPPKPVGKVSIVIDDIGYTLNPLKQLLKLGEPFTYAVIPHLSHSAESARLIREAGGEMILHLPMEPHRFQERFSGTQPGMLETRMTENELISQLEKNYIPGIVGINNHMGSKFTQNRTKMTQTLRWIKQKGLFFLDSMTSPKSVGWELAGELGIKRAQRSVFLDNDKSFSAIEQEWNKMVKIAKSNGHTIAIGHLRNSTIKALVRLLPKLRDQGIQLVPLSTLVD